MAVLQALHPSEVGVQRTGCGALFQALVSIVHCGAAYAQAVLADADGAVAVVAALKAHLSHVAVQQNGCGALSKIAHGGAMCAQVVVDAGAQAAWRRWWAGGAASASKSMCGRAAECSGSKGRIHKKSVNAV